MDDRESSQQRKKGSCVYRKTADSKEKQALSGTEEQGCGTSEELRSKTCQSEVTLRGSAQQGHSRSPTQDEYEEGDELDISKKMLTPQERI